MERGNKFYIKYSLYNIAFFMLALLAFLSLSEPDFFKNFVNYQNDGKALSEASLSHSSSSGNMYLAIYEEIAANIATAVDHAISIPISLLSLNPENESHSTFLNIYGIAIPFIFSAIIFIMILNIITEERLLICSIINSSVISFSIIISVVSNNLSRIADIAFSITQISAYSILNSLIFLVIYVIIMRFFEKDINSQ